MNLRPLFLAPEGDNASGGTATATEVPPAPDATKGSGDRFSQLLATKQAVMETSPDNLNNKVDERNEVKPEPKNEVKVETKTEKPDPDAIPDFGKKPEVKAETAANYDEELKSHPAIKGEAAKSFKAVLAQRDEAKKAADALKADYEARIAAIESKAAGAPSKAQEEALAALQKKNADLEEQVGKANFERTPKYQGYLKQEKQELDAAKSYVDGDDEMTAAIETAASLTGQKRLKALVNAGMNAETISAVAANLARVDQIRRGRMEEVENWRTATEEMTQAERAEQLTNDVKRREYEDTVFQSVLSKVTSPDGLEGFRKVDGFDSWNTGTVDENIKQAKRMFNGEAELPELGEVVMKGIAYAAKQKLFDNLQKKYDGVVEELSRLKAAASPNGTVKSDKVNGAQEQGSAASRFEATLAAHRGQ